MLACQWGVWPTSKGRAGATAMLPLTQSNDKSLPAVLKRAQACHLIHKAKSGINAGRKRTAVTVSKRASPLLLAPRERRSRPLKWLRGQKRHCTEEGRWRVAQCLRQSWKAGSALANRNKSSAANSAVVARSYDIPAAHPNESCRRQAGSTERDTTL